jgi:hypothetical protein
MRPRLENRVRVATKALTLTVTERAKAHQGTEFDTTDDALRAIIRGCEWMLFAWVNELAVDEYNQRRDELDRQMSP